MLSAGSRTHVLGTDYSEIVSGVFCRGFALSLCLVRVKQILGKYLENTGSVRVIFDSVQKLGTAEKEVTRRGVIR